jgi:hypothetical protein
MRSAVMTPQECHHQSKRVARLLQIKPAAVVNPYRRSRQCR